MAEVARVVFRKQVSDGNYGTEAAEVHLDVDVELLQGSALSDIDKAREDAVAAALATARRMVHDELRQSPSGNVRRALEYPKYEREERWRQAEESAELELAIGRRENARQDDEDDPDLPY